MPREERRETTRQEKPTRSKKGDLADVLKKLEENCNKVDTAEKIVLLNTTLEKFLALVEKVFEAEADSGTLIHEQKGAKIQGALATLSAYGDQIRLLAAVDKKRKRAAINAEVSSDEDESDAVQLCPRRRKNTHAR